MACSLMPSSRLPSTGPDFQQAPSPGRRGRRRITRIIAQSSSQKGENLAVDSSTDYYSILGVPVDASHEEIRKAYRRMQKTHHPDVAGPEGHAMTLLLNEAYRTLTSKELRHAYTFSHSNARGQSDVATSEFTGFAYSSWDGPDRPQAIFVDENSCIGCRECVHHASKTFTMDDACGCARVFTQWGDSESQIKVALEACPVNCIHYVERGDLPVLEYLMRPQAKASNGVYGGGWERPKNIFMAARTFKRKIEASSKSGRTASWQKETAAQRKARVEADLKMRAGAFWWLWSWGTRFSDPNTSTKKETDTAGNWSWKGLFGRSCRLELLVLPVDPEKKVVEAVQEWAMTFASSSELPLPFPFRADPLPNGVQLTLVTTNNGVVEPMGSLLVTVKDEEDGSYLTVQRQGVTGTGSLPGESTIIQHLKDAVKGQENSYSMYNIPRV